MIVENLVNDVAMALGVDAARVRELNLLQEGQSNLFKQDIEPNILRRCWDECLQQSDYHKKRLQVEEFNAKNRWRKRGVAVIPTLFGVATGAKFVNQTGL